MGLSNLAVPAVYALISFLAYTSQWLFLSLEPHPLTKDQLVRFNILLICLLISYTRSVFTDPGRFPETGQKEIENGDAKDGKQGQKVRKWCRKCNAVKPPRAHHCRTCGRCIPKMDHHCPWTANCVSHTTFPHFLRFLFYAVTSMTYLSSFLWTRCAYLWNHRSMPSYLGPSMPQLALLFLLCVTNSMILFALTILLVRNIWCLAVNTTTIEGWEIERHETLVRRARYFGGYLEGPDGIQIPIRKQEFPYDIGIWKNCKQGMGTGNVLAWFWPLAATPPVATGISFETNGFEDASVSWPPPDPDRLQRSNIRQPGEAFTYRDAGLSDRETLIAFRKRQSEDLELRKRKPFLQRLEAQKAAGSLRRGEERVEETAEYGYGSDDAGEDGEREGEDMNGGKGLENVDEGEEAWRNSEGERLGDFGVDEDVEFYDEEEDDIPLSELLARRKARETGLTTKS